MRTRNRIPSMQQPAPKPKTVTLTVTKEQINGMKIRQQQIKLATMKLNDYLSGIVAGHGHENARVTEYDDTKLTLTIAVQP